MELLLKLEELAAETFRGYNDKYYLVKLGLAWSGKFEGSIELEKTGGVELDPQKHGAGDVFEDEKVRLSMILEKLNDCFGTQFTETDFLSREQVKEDMLNDEDLRQKVANNTKENFKFAFEKHS